MNPIYDQLKRPLRDLRISVTDRCNFRCSYCMPAEIFGPDFAFLPHDDILSFEEVTRLVKIFVSFGVKKIRITGGEPLMRRDLPVLVRMIRDVDGVEDIAMTTNGSLLKQYARPLKEAGLDRVSVSLDSLDEERFFAMNGRRGKVKTVLAGIEAAAEAGLQVKVNMVVQQGKNTADILPMAQYFKDKKHILRFIEYMDVGSSNGWRLDEVVSKQAIVDELSKKMPVKLIAPNYQGEVASRFAYEDGDGEVGVISSVTDSFCGNCSRARISAEGKMYTCLFATEGTDLRSLLRSEASDDDVARKIASIWQQRTDRYSEERTAQTARHRKGRIEMSHIGG